MRKNNVTEKENRTIRALVAMVLVFLQLVSPFSALAEVVEIPKEAEFDSAQDMRNVGDEFNLSQYNAVVLQNHTASSADTEGGIAIKGNSYITPENGYFNYGAFFDLVAEATGGIDPLALGQRIALLLAGKIFLPEVSYAKTVVGKGRFIIDEAYKDELKTQIVDYEAGQANQLLFNNGYLRTTNQAYIQSIFEGLENQYSQMETNFQKIINNVTEFESGSYHLQTDEATFEVKQSTASGYEDMLVVNVPADENNTAYIPQASEVLDFFADRDTGNPTMYVIITTDAEKVVFADTLGGAGGNFDLGSPEFKKAADKTTYYFPNAKQVTNFSSQQKGIAPDITDGGTVNPDAPVIVDADGKTIGDGYSHSYTDSSRYINRQQQHYTAVAGSVFAPEATTIMASGNINGFVFVKNLHQRLGAEMHNFFFYSDKFLDKFSGSVELTKTDDKSGEVLAGAEFKLVQVISETETKVVRENIATDENGKLFINGLEPGTYQLVETKAPVGYELDPTPIEFEITADDITNQIVVEVSKTNTKQLGSVELTKTDDKSGEVLTGAEFKLVQVISATETKVVRENIVTDENGKLFIDGLEPGTYQLIETKAPVGYDLDPTPVEFEITAENITNQTVVEVSKTNTKLEVGKQLGSVELTKTDDKSGEVLAGAEFKLVQVISATETKVVRENIETDENGKLIINGLEPGTYQLVETKAPVGYDLDPTPVEFEITAENITNQTVVEVSKTNTKLEVGKQLGSVELTKTDDQSGEVLTGAEFKLVQVISATETKVVRENIVTDENGKLIINGLEPGTYQLVETKAPVGYDLDPTPVEFEITAENITNQTVVEVSKTNTKLEVGKQLGSVELTKTDDQSGEVLAGAEFKLVQVISATETKVIRENIVTDENGKLIINGLEPGTYQLVETKAPVGYDLDPTPVEFEITAENITNQTVVEVSKTNTKLEVGKQLGSVELTKTDDQSGEVLAGAEFKLVQVISATETKVIRENIVTDENGKLIINGLEPGTYQLVETKAPVGYDLDPTPVEFEITAENITNQTVVEVSKTNTEIPTTGGAKFIKTDQDGTPLKDAVFQIQDKDGNPISVEEFTSIPKVNADGNIVTDETGIIEIKGLKLDGEYYLVEIQAPTGYEKLENPVRIVLVEDENVTALLPEYVTNTKQLGSVELTKTDDQSGEVLAGAEFKLVQVISATETKVVRENIETDENGKLIINGLEPGTYQLVETKAPVGYDLDATPVGFEITAENITNQTVVEVSKTNTKLEVGKQLGSVELTKTDDQSGEVLTGAEFKLVQVISATETKVVRENIETDENGKLIINGLEPGTYQLVETKAPVGYDLDPTPVGFEITAENITNQTVVEVSKTNTKLEVGKQLGSVELTKTDDQSGEVLAGAEFKLVQVISATETKVVRENIETDENGKLIINGLEPGTYQLVETKAPVGYDLDPTPVGFEITAENITNQTVVEVSKTNTKLEVGKQLGSVELTKTDDQSGEVLTGAEFKLVQVISATETKVVRENIETDENGKLIINGLEPGTYQLVETKAPVGYDLDATPVGFEITAENITNQTVVEVSKTNTKLEVGKQLGSVELTKTDDQSGEVLTGAEFKLVQVISATETKVVRENIETDENGKLIINGLEPGTYQLVETKAPVGYDLDATPVGFEITAENITNQTVVEVSKTNTKLEVGKQLGSVELTKTDDQSGEVLTGAEFKLVQVISATETKVVRENIETDENGKLIINGLEPGTYQLVETKAPVGYDLDATPVGFEITAENITNQTVVEVSKTNTKLEVGKQLGSVELTKTDDQSGEVLTGAEFKLVQVISATETKVVRENIETDENGKLIINGLEPGTYQLVETKAPVGYDLDATPVGFEITAENITNQTVVEVSKTNTKLEVGKQLGSVELTKTDDQSGEVLTGAEFKLVQVISATETKVVRENIETDENGKLIINGLEPGTYQLVETKAPVGYDLDATPVGFEITAENITNQTVVEVSKTNTKLEVGKQLGSVELTKTDDQSGEVLTGAEFKLVQIISATETKVIRENIVTDENGKLIINGLEAGTYQLVETKAPVGYDLDATPVGFEITAENITNQTVVEVSKTNMKTVIFEEENQEPEVDTEVEPEVDSEVKPEEDKPTETLPNTGLISQELLVAGMVLTSLGSFTLRKRNKKDAK